MTNLIQVHKTYVPFRWIGDRLEARFLNAWREVEKTSIKNKEGEYIFILKGANKI